jgi:predicted small secreted protein
MNKKRYSILLTTLIFATFVLTACDLTALQGVGKTVAGSGNVVEETREVSGVSGVQLATIGDMVIELGDEESLRIEAEDNLMEYFETEVRNGKLIIGTQDNVSLNNTKPVKYTLLVTGLDTIEISSIGNIEAPDLQAEQFTINMDSTGDLNMGELIADTLEVDMDSTGNLNIAGGEVSSQNITIDSTGNYMAEELASKNADVRLNSTGNATIWVRDQLKANLNSTGNVRYRGNPTVDATTNSTGDVIKIGE